MFVNLSPKKSQRSNSVPPTTPLSLYPRLFHSFLPTTPIITWWLRLIVIPYGQLGIVHHQWFATNSLPLCVFAVKPGHLLQEFWLRPNCPVSMLVNIDRIPKHWRNVQFSLGRQQKGVSGQSTKSGTSYASRYLALQRRSVTPVLTVERSCGAIGVNEAAQPSHVGWWFRGADLNIVIIWDRY